MSQGQRPAKRTCLGLDGAARREHHRRSLVAAVTRGLEILYPGCAAARQAKLDGIAEASWNRQLDDIIDSEDEDELSVGAGSEGGVAAAAASGGAAAAAAPEPGSQSQAPSERSPAQATQLTPVLQYCSAPDSVDSARLSASSPSSTEQPGSGPSPTDEPAAAAVATPAAEAWHCPSAREITAEVRKLLGPSYSCCEQLCAVLTPASTHPNSLEQRLRLCSELELYGEYAAAAQRTAPPALLLLALRQEVQRLQSAAAQESALQSGADGRRNSSAINAMAEAAVAAGVPAATVVGRSLEAALAPDAAAPLRAILLSDRSWRAARSLGSVHGIDLLEAAQISRDHPTRTSGSTLLQEELTPCQRLALTVRGQHAAPRLCPRPVLAEVFQRLESELSRSSTYHAYWPGNIEQGPQAPGYALMVLLVRLDGEAMAPLPDGFAFNDARIQQSFHVEVEALLRRISEGGHSPSPAGSALTAAAAENLRCAKLREHSLSWDAHAGDGCVCERLCAHMQLGESQLLLDARIVPKRWSGLAMLWHALGPTHMTRLLASGALESLGCGSPGSPGGDCSDFLAQFCSDDIDINDLLRKARGPVIGPVLIDHNRTTDAIYLPEEGSAAEDEDQAAAASAL